jgi:hypothetical protein
LNDAALVAVPEKNSVTGTFYRDHVLTAVINHYVTKNTRAVLRWIKLLHDNAPAHMSALVKVYL